MGRELGVPRIAQSTDRIGGTQCRRLSCPTFEQHRALTCSYQLARIGVVLAGLSQGD
jgi:hypothetical protein